MSAGFCLGTTSTVLCQHTKLEARPVEDGVSGVLFDGFCVGGSRFEPATLLELFVALVFQARCFLRHEIVSDLQGRSGTLNTRWAVGVTAAMVRNGLPCFTYLFCGMHNDGRKVATGCQGLPPRMLRLWHRRRAFINPLLKKVDLQVGTCQSVGDSSEHVPCLGLANPMIVPKD